MAKSKIFSGIMSAFFVMGAILSTANGQSGDKFQTAYREFKTSYEAEMKRAKITGSSFYLVKDNQVIAKEHLGLQDVENKIPVDENTIYHWASITKTFTGIAIMQLRDRGLLKLDDPVVKYLPELEKVHNPHGEMREITIKHLMTHTAGFRNPTWTWRDKDWQPFEPQKWEQLAAMMPYTEILFKPGTKFSYSNPAIIYLGKIIEQLSGEDFEVYIDKNIFRPLEMSRSYFDKTPPYLLKNRAHSYYVENGKRRTARFDADTGVTVSNGGLNSPLPDMVKYANFLLGEAKKQELYDTVLKRSSLEEMWQPQIETKDDFTQGRMRKETMIGLAFFIDDISGIRYIGHNGDQNGFKAYLCFAPKLKAAGILVFNTETQPTENSPKNLSAAESKIALSVDKLFESLTAK